MNRRKDNSKETKKCYVSPQLTIHGNISEITLAKKPLPQSDIPQTGCEAS